MPRFRFIPLLVALNLLFATGLRTKEKASTELNEVWANAADSLSIEARVALKKTSGVDERTKALATVVLGLARPPISTGDWDDLEPVLARLATGDDTIAARAQFLRARMYQVHMSTPDYDRAEELYRELAERWPGSHWAQLGYVKLGLVKLYALPEPSDSGERMRRVEALLSEIHEPTLQRDLRLQMGRAGMFHKRPLDEVLSHLIAAEAIPGMMGITPEELKIQIGELSFRAGHLEQAKRYFEEFLATYPSNTRRFNVRQQLKKVRAALGEKEGAP